MQVAMRQFKASVSNYVARAQQGQSIEITSHKRPVARLVGLPTLKGKSLKDDSTLALMNHPAISWGGGKPANPVPVTISVQGMALSDMAMQDR